MDKNWRSKFNESWKAENYQAMYEKIKVDFNHDLPFRMSETPGFFDQDFVKLIVDAANDIGSQIASKQILEFSDSVFDICPYKVPGDESLSSFFQADFGITIDEDGKIIPQLIEVQGFPSLYFYQSYLAHLYKDAYDLDQNLSIYLNGMVEERYFDHLKEIILNGESPENVVMLEIEPEKQNTYIDFLCTSQALGIKILCISKVIKDGKKLYYKDENGDLIAIKRIYNRIIFDELIQKKLDLDFNLTDEVEVTWAGHPNWFFKLSKFILPRLSGPFVPKSYFLNEAPLDTIDLNDYVLKPLFSFAGSGVVLNVNKEVLSHIQEPQNYILQKKVNYAPVIETPDGPSKCEIRIMYLWLSGDEKPTVVSNLLRMSKGEMIGVKYNKNKTWVGGSVGFSV
ncbi:MAG TPA: hypothetical protein PLZ32_22425, partial [Saprospiraceae bacterium]|nr:hypothetical protein [Saprospiraceae bacterium]